MVKKRFETIRYKDLWAVFSNSDNYSKRWLKHCSGGKLHEPITTKMLLDTLKKDYVFVDIGANLGYFTVMAGKFLTEGKVYSFDVDNKVVKLLKKNIRLNNLKNVQAYNYGVSDKKGLVKILKMKLPDPRTSFQKTLDKDKKYLSVKTISLDGFFKNKKAKPNVIKIDVEGAELLVLKGMKSLLENEKLVLLMEIHGNKLSKFNTDSREIISFLIDRGYDVYEVGKYKKGKNKGKLSKNTLLNYNTMCYVIKKLAS